MLLSDDVLQATHVVALINIFPCCSCRGQFKFGFLSPLPIHDQHKARADVVCYFNARVRSTRDPSDSVRLTPNTLI